MILISLDNKLYENFLMYNPVYKKPYVAKTLLII